jgi:hypothetical protein
MELEKNPKTRSLYRRLLKLGDRVIGPAFPKLKRVKQKTVDYCGPAVLEALFSFLGIRVSQARVVRSLRAQNKIKRIGLSVKDLGRAVKALGKGEYSFWRKANSSVTDLDAVVNKYKFPVGVEWQGVFYEFEDEDSGHYGIVTRVDRKAGFLRLADSFHAFSGIDRKFDIKYFVKRWWDTNIIKGRTLTDRKMMFVITSEGDTWPKNLGMKRAK